MRINNNNKTFNKYAICVTCRNFHFLPPPPPALTPAKLCTAQQSKFSLVHCREMALQFHFCTLKNLCSILKHKKIQENNFSIN